MTPAVFIPIRSFHEAKKRLASVLSSADRARLAEALAGRTIAAVHDAGLTPTVISSAGEVLAWADDSGVATVADPGSLDAAAHLATAVPEWLVVHADLPLLRPSDLGGLTSAGDARPVVAPSYDGGTTAILGSGPFPFSYGPASFHRHVAHAARVHVAPGFLLDIDRPGDLEAAQHHSDGAWLQSVLPAP